MKKWMIVFIIFFGLIVIWGVTIYQGALSPEKTAAKKAIERAEQEVGEIQVNDVEHYYGTKAYHIVQGVTEDGVERVIWVPDEGDTDLIVKKADDGIGLQAVRDQVFQEVNPREIIDIRLGVEEKIPVWEVTYIDQQDRYSYYYMDFEEGIFVKRYSIEKNS